MIKEKNKPGRPVSTSPRCSMNISGKKEQLDKLREMARKEGKAISEFILEKCGIK